MADRDVTPEQRRSVIRLLAEAAVELKDKNIEILTTDSPMDGAYLLELLKDDPPRQEYVRKLLTNAGGCSTGVKVANINHQGDVHPCHFHAQVVVGNVRERSFRDIMDRSSHPGAAGTARYQIQSQGSMRKMRIIGNYVEDAGQKAYYYHQDLLAEDPTCILEQHGN